MGRFGNIWGKQAVKAFQRAGWEFSSQLGSHVVLTKAGERANLTVPQHKELKEGTLRSLIRLSGLSVDEFVALL
jgi:predicted RNA binding protein YcfA (HicA-like mRNA interferase family)